MAMMFQMKVPKNTKDLSWTRHVLEKMLFYNLSQGRVRRVIKTPSRREVGVAPGTTAVMQRNDKPRRKEEIWVMYKENSKFKNQNSKLGIQNSNRVIISAWRYPGVSPKGKEIPIPEEIREYLNIF